MVLASLCYLQLQSKKKIHAAIISTSLCSGDLLISLQNEQRFLYINIEDIHLASTNRMRVEIRLKKQEINSFLPQWPWETLEKECLVWIWRERNVNILHAIAFHKPMLYIRTIKISLTIKTRNYFFLNVVLLL